MLYNIIPVLKIIVSRFRKYNLRVFYQKIAKTPDLANVVKFRNAVAYSDSKVQEQK